MSDTRTGSEAGPRTRGGDRIVDERPVKAGLEKGGKRKGLEGARERWVRTPEGIDLCVAELGEADGNVPTVVLIHGYPDSKEVWAQVAGQLADRFHVVLYDVRGCVRSSAPEPLRGGFT